MLGISCYRPEKEQDKEQDKEQKEDNEEKKEDVTKEEEKDVKEKKEEEVKTKKEDVDNDDEEQGASLLARSVVAEMEKDKEKEREKEFALKGLEDDMKEMISVKQEAFEIIQCVYPKEQMCIWNCMLGWFGKQQDPSRIAIEKLLYNTACIVYTVFPRIEAASE